MYRDSDQDYLLIDWEYAGILGNPAIDIASWMGNERFEYLEHEDYYLEVYWNALIEAGVDANDYPLDKLKHDYLFYGTGHLGARFAGFGAIPGYPIELACWNVQHWFDHHPGLTPDDMTLPTYGWFDFMGPLG